MARWSRAALGGVLGIALFAHAAGARAADRQDGEASADEGASEPAAAGPAIDGVEAEAKVEPFDVGLLGEALPAAVASAIATHPDVQAAQFALKAADADLTATKWQRFPSVSVEALAIRQSSNQLQAQVVVDQPLWTGGRISGSVSRARSAEQSAFAGYDEAVQQIAVSVAQAFFDYRRLTARVAILEDSLAKHRAMVQTMERRVRQEVSPLSDLELARSRSSQLELQLAQIRAALAEGLQRLRELVGISGYEPPTEQLDAARLPRLASQGLINDAMRNDPTLKRLRFTAQVTQEEARVARASILPQLSAQYSYSETMGHRVGVVLKAQANSGLSAWSVASSARYRGDASDAKVASAERELRSQMVRDFEDYEASRARAASGQAAALAAMKVTESYMRQFVSGRRTWLDVMNAVRESMSSQIDVVDARFGAEAAYARLALRSGRWRPDGKGLSR